ncbi:hypothetical protein Lal_00018842 [Lupinus albus]|nr:hypothetical protein Lal_00018842 [Lupinus albus]
MQHYFPHGKFMDLKTNISIFIQGVGESLCEVWDRLKSMLKNNINGFFNATPSGQILSKPPQEAFDIIESMAQNDQKVQHQGGPQPPRRGGMIELSSTDVVLTQNKLLEQQLDEIKKKLTDLPNN